MPLKFGLLFCFVFYFAHCKAQSMGRFLKESNEFMSDAGGNPLYMQTIYNVEGSPFFQDYYQPARITLNEKIFVVPIKINLLDNTILFEHNGIIMVTTMPANKIEFLDADSNTYNLTFKSGFPSIANLTTNTFYMMIDSGKATLLKHISITYKDEKPYYSATITRIFEEKAFYYIFFENSIIPFPKNNENLLKILKYKPKELTAFLLANKFNINNEESLEKIISYYNSLFK